MRWVIMMIFDEIECGNGMVPRHHTTLDAWCHLWWPIIAGWPSRQWAQPPLGQWITVTQPLALGGQTLPQGSRLRLMRSARPGELALWHWHPPQ